MMYLSLVNSWVGHKGSIYALAQDGEHHMLSAGSDGWLVRWQIDREDGQLVADVGEQVFSICRLPEYTVLGTMAGAIFFLDTDKEARKKTFHQQGIFDITFDRERIISAGGDGVLGIWDRHTLQLKESVALSHQRLRSLSWSDGMDLAVGASDGCIYLLDKDLQHLATHTQAHLPSVFSVQWWKDQLISGGRDAHMRRWESSSQQLASTQDVPAHWYTINAVRAHPFAALIATASRDKTIKLWRAADLKLLQVMDHHKNSVNDLQWTLDGKHLIAGSDDHTISVWALNDLGT